MKTIRKQLILAVSMVFLVLAVCSAAAAAEVSDNGTQIQVQNQTVTQLVSHNSTNINSVQSSITTTNSVQTSTTNTDSSQSSTSNTGSEQTDTTKQPSKVVISGQVTKCSSGEPFAGATVTASKDGTKLASTTTKEDGTYNLEFLSDGGVFNVTASYPGHESSTKEVNVTPDQNDTNSGTADFQLGVPETFVDDNWVGLPNGTVVFFPGDPNPHVIGTDAFATISDGVTNANPGGTVHIADGTYTGAANRGITINKDLTIVGQSQAGTIIDAQGADRIFTIDPGNTVTIQDLTFTNGNAVDGGAIWNYGTLTVEDCTLNNNTATNDGGAIYNRGPLNIINSTLNNNNTAKSGGAITNLGTLNITNSTLNNNTATYWGGAIYNLGNLNITNSTLNNNTTTDGGGGAIYNRETLNITNSTLNNNTATDDRGGAIVNRRNLNITNSTLNNNTTFIGGAIYNDGNLNITNSTLNNNTAYWEGGAIGNDGNLNITNSTLNNNTAYWGGAIYNRETLNITNSTLNNNTAYWGGGAIVNRRNLNITNSTLNNNTATNDRGGAIYNDGNLNITNSTLNNNTAYWGGAIGNNGPMNVTGSNFENNTAHVQGGAIWNNGGDASNRNVHFNRIVGNSPSNSEVYSKYGTLDATLNWWGSNSSPAGKIETGPGGVVLFDPWLILSITASPTTIYNGGTSQVTADLLYDNHGNYHDPALGHVPDGIPITLTTDWGSFTNPTLTHSIILDTVNGSVTATFYANEGPTPSPPLNPVKITATADGYTTNDAESAYILILTPLIIINIGDNASILSPHQSQSQGPVQTQTQNSTNTNNNNLTNENTNALSNVNTFDPVILSDNSNHVSNLTINSFNVNSQIQSFIRRFL